MRDIILGARTLTSEASDGLETLTTQVRDDPALKEVVDALDTRRLAEFGAFHTALQSSYTNMATGRPKARCWPPHRPGERLPQRCSP